MISLKPRALFAAPSPVDSVRQPLFVVESVEFEGHDMSNHKLLPESCTTAVCSRG